MKKYIAALLVGFLGAAPAMATTSITPKASGSSFTMDFCLDSVTTNIRQCMYLLDPATALPISPFPSGGSIGNTAFIANAGTNLNTSLLALETGGNLATLAASITANVQQHNTKQINGVTPLMGNGVSGTGSQRVNIASDNTAFSVNANAGTNLNTSLLALESGGNLATLAGAITSSVGQTNEKQINGVVPLMGNGVTGTGSQRVTISSDNTAFSVNLGTIGGASTAAKQPALGTAGTPSADYISVQGSSAGTPIPVAQAVNVTATDCSGTITAGGTAQSAFTAQTTLHGFTIANIDTTEVLWISFTGTAAASGTASYPLAAATPSTFTGLNSFSAPPGFGLNHALSVIAATTSHKFSCTWW